jgi:hypothetical protein
LDFAAAASKKQVCEKKYGPWGWYIDFMIRILIIVIIIIIII